MTGHCKLDSCRDIGIHRIAFFLCGCCVEKHHNPLERHETKTTQIFMYGKKSLHLFAVAVDSESILIAFFFFKESALFPSLFNSNTSRSLFL